MKRFSMQLGVTLVSAVLAGGMGVGCASHETESEKTQKEADKMTDAATMIGNGEKNVADGKTEIARGQALKDQGNDVEGDRLIAEGKATQVQGEEQIAQGKKLKPTD